MRREKALVSKNRKMQTSLYKYSESITQEERYHAFVHQALLSSQTILSLTNIEK